LLESKNINNGPQNTTQKTKNINNGPQKTKNINNGPQKNTQKTKNINNGVFGGRLYIFFVFCVVFCGPLFIFLFSV
jgi:hypothetical protein